MSVNALLAGSAYAGNADFRLVNRTGQTISSVFVAPVDESWGDDRLGEEVLQHGNSMIINFADDAQCHQRLYVKFEDDQAAQLSDANLCALNEITLGYNEQTGDLWASSD